MTREQAIDAAVRRCLAPSTVRKIAAWPKEPFGNFDGPQSAEWWIEFYYPRRVEAIRAEYASLTAA